MDAAVRDDPRMLYTLQLVHSCVCLQVASRGSHQTKDVVDRRLRQILGSVFQTNQHHKTACGQRDSGHSKVQPRPGRVPTLVNRAQFHRGHHPRHRPASSRPPYNPPAGLGPPAPVHQDSAPHGLSAVKAMHSVCRQPCMQLILASS